MAKPIAVIDTETDPFKKGRMPKPFIGGFYTRIDGKPFYREFFCMDALADMIKQFDGYVYAHNGGKFDWHFMLDHIESNPKYKLKIINGRLSEFRMGKAICRDSMNILPVSLAAMEKEKFEYWKMEKSVRDKYMDEIRAYLKSDCINLYNYVSAYIFEYGNNLTLAGGAMKFWRKQYKQIHGKAPYEPETGVHYYETYAPYYFGGRVSTFKSGVHHGRFEMVDINSAYPTVMMNEHPWGKAIEHTKNLPDTDELNLCFVDVLAVSKGALPLRKKNGGIEFPDDDVQRVYRVTGHEIKAGLETNTVKIIKVLNVHKWKQSINFSDYVNYFYSMKALQKKEDPEHPNYLFYKLHLNTLYGKWSSNPQRYKNWRLGEYGDEFEGWEPGEILGEYQLYHQPLAEEEMRFYNVATAASITGAVRAYLWESILQCDTPYYCDTDSILCKGKGDIKIGTKLGEWEVEGVAKKIAIAGRKLYAITYSDEFYEGMLDKWRKGGEKGDKPKNVKERSKGVRATAAQIEAVAADPTASIVCENEAPTFSLSRGKYFVSRKIRNTCNLDDIEYEEDSTPKIILAQTEKKT